MLPKGLKPCTLNLVQSPSLYFCKSTHPPIRLDRVSVHMQYAETNFLCVSKRHAAQRVRTMHPETGAKSLLKFLQVRPSAHPSTRLDRVCMHIQYAETNFLCVSQDMLPKGFKPCTLTLVQSPSIFCLCKVPLSIFASLYFCKSTHPPIRLDCVGVHIQ